MSTSLPSPVGPATTAKRGTLSAADKVKVDAINGTNTGDVTVTSPAGWLSQVGQALTFALVVATTGVAGVVSAGAQILDGVKTFANAIIASAGVQLASLWNTNGTNALDVCIKSGSSTPDGNMVSGAQLHSWRTGIGTGTEINKAWLTHAAGGVALNLQNGASNRYVIDSDGTTGILYFRINALPLLMITGSGYCRTAYGFDVNPGAGATLTWQVLTDGIVKQAGTDSSTAPGAKTVAKPSGKNAIAAGASSVVVTNSLASAAMFVLVSPAVRDATCKEVIGVCGPGTITFSGSAAATADLPFAWELKAILS